MPLLEVVSHLQTTAPDPGNEVRPGGTIRLAGGKTVTLDRLGIRAGWHQRTTCWGTGKSTGVWGEEPCYPEHWAVAEWDRLPTPAGEIYICCRWNLV